MRNPFNAIKASARLTMPEKSRSLRIIKAAAAIAARASATAK
jgi:hypothetical protein